MRNFLLLSIVFLSTIFASAQSLTSISPTNSPKGKTVSVTIYGIGTNFTDPTTTVSFNQGGVATSVITLNSFTATNDTLLVANITISSLATTGLYDIFIYDVLDGSMYLDSSFNVSNAGAKSISINPKQGSKGQTLTITITGNNTSFLQGNNTLTFFGQGSNNAFITNSITRISATEMEASITIPTLATIGGYSLIFNTISDGQLLILNNAFKVIPPSIKTVLPTSAFRGDTITVSITGSNTHFTQGTSSSLVFSDNNSPQSNLTLNTYSILNDTSITANVIVPISSSIESYNLLLSDSIDGVLLYSNAITIESGSLLSIAPKTAARSQTLLVTITGKGMAFEQGNTTVTFYNSGVSTDVTINSITVNSPNNLTANITIQPNAFVGLYDVKIYSPTDGIQSFNQGFTITGPEINFVTPLIVKRGRRTALTVFGSKTHFMQASGTSVSFYNQGTLSSVITVDSTKAVNDTNLTAYINVSKTASDNIYELRVYDTIDNEMNFPGGISIAPPSIYSVSPNTSPNNNTLDILLTGVGTNFTLAVDTNFNFSNPNSNVKNISISAIKAINDTAIKLTVQVNSNAPVGYYSLNYFSVVDGSMKIPFLVTPKVPSILSVSPNALKRGASDILMIVGKNTGFLQSGNSLSIGFMKQGTTTHLINIDSTIVLDDYHIQLSITLDSTFAVVGNYDVIVSDSIDSILTKTNAITISNVGINEVTNQPSRLKIYPNPTTDIFTIELNKQDAEVKELLITDITGRSIYESKSPKIQPDGTIRLDVKELAICKGTYFIKISTANNRYFSKLMIE